LQESGLFFFTDAAGGQHHGSRKGHENNWFHLARFRG
jgi:hypothetical protein